MSITTGFTKEAWIEKRTAEGFTKEQAIHEFDRWNDPMIAKAQEQKVPTKGEMIEMIHEARQKNTNKNKLYKPNFALSKKYQAVKKEKDEAAKAQDFKLAEALSKKMLSIQINGTIDADEYQAKVDQSLEMPIASILAERKKCEAVIAQCEKALDSNWDLKMAERMKQ